MKKALLFLLLFSFIASVSAQNSETCHTIEGVKGSSVAVDPNGNVYVIDGPTLHKLARNGNELFPYQYSNFQLGDISSVDVDNPLKIMLFYQDEGIILFLDEKIEGIEHARNQADMLTCIYHYYEENAAFVDATIKSAAKDLFGEFIFNTCFQCFTRFVEAVDLSKKVDKNHKKNIVRYYSSAFSSLIVNYLEISKVRTLKGLMSQFEFLNEGEVARSIQVLVQKEL